MCACLDKIYIYKIRKQIDDLMIWEGASASKTHTHTENLIMSTIVIVIFHTKYTKLSFGL